MISLTPRYKVQLVSVETRKVLKSQTIYQEDFDRELCFEDLLDSFARAIRQLPEAKGRE